MGSIYNRAAFAFALIITFSIVTPGISSAQDSSLNRRQSGLLAPLIRPDLGGQVRALSTESAASASSSPVTGIDDYGEQEILVRVDDWQPWSFGSSLGYEYQTNAALGTKTEVEDFLFRESASGRGTFSVSDTMYIDAGLQQQLYRYEDLDLLDFDRLDTDAGILWVLPQSLPSWLAGAVLTLKGDWYRMSQAGDFSEELFSNAGVSAGLLKSIALGRNQSLLLSGTADVSLYASDDVARRHEYAALAAWQARWSPRWESSIFVRAALYDYKAHDDWNTTIAASVDYRLTSWCRLGISSNLIFNASDVDAFDYENVGVGANLRMAVRF
ncbi:MAG: hypothetical protein KDN22_23795 [Verrucomicrobiae bacterium]|nr:hypothetical protein [Verrucomicrobiae bacterium]